MGKRQTFKTTKDDDGKRLDAICRRILAGLGLGVIQKAIRKGDIRIDGKRAHPDDRVQAGKILEIYEQLVEKAQNSPPRPRLAHKSPRRWNMLDLEAMIVRRNDHVIVFNKARGVLVHGPDSLDSLVKTHLPSQSLSFQPGPLHRLDQNTSGLVVFGLSLEAARVFDHLLRSGLLKKTYLALLCGQMIQKRECRLPLLKDSQRGLVQPDPSGKPSATDFVPLLAKNGLTLALCYPRTGRTHQIRVHAQAIGHPLAGDGKYGGGKLEGGFVLHAWRLHYPKEAYSVLGPPPLIAHLPSPSRNSILTRLNVTAQELEKILERQEGR